MYAAFFHHRQLLVGTALASGDDCTGMAHAFAFRGRNAGNETDHGLLHVAFDPARAFFFIAAANLADHDDCIGFGIVVEQAHHIDMLHPVDGIATNTHAGGLTIPQCTELPDRFISQRTGTRNHADAAFLVDVSGHDADLDLVRSDQAGTVWPDE